MLTAWASGTPTTDPQLQIITNELRDSIRHDVRPHSARKASVAPSPVSHGVRGHMPHDPSCIACKQARLTATPANRNPLDSVIEDSDKGFVLGIVHLYGPFTPDVDGNVYALVGVEVGHTVMEFRTLLLRSRLNTIEYRSTCPLFGRAPNDSISPSLPYYWL